MSLKRKWLTLEEKINVLEDFAKTKSSHRQLAESILPVSWNWGNAVLNNFSGHQSNFIGHINITDKVDSLPVIDMVGDSVCPKYSFETPIQVILRSRTEWRVNWTEQCRKRVVWFTDGSKIACGTGAGVYGAKPEILIESALGRYATVFQAEVFAINTCAEENLRMNPRNREVCIFSDSHCFLQNYLFPGLEMQKGPRTTGSAQ
uniref:RNase H type-1 domain-containing protein n=1 Tax=Rhodnius prolixus TaxID=13249 RepID=T1I299_RHOPR